MRAVFIPPPEDAYQLGPDGRWGPWKGDFGPRLRLEPQQAIVAQVAKP